MIIYVLLKFYAAVICTQYTKGVIAETVHVQNNAR